jgi:hypothetical protein
MRIVVVVLLAGCTIGGSRAPAPHPRSMPSAVLDTHDPSVDTSKHPAMNRTAGAPAPTGSTAAHVVAELAKLAMEIAK